MSRLEAVMPVKRLQLLAFVGAAVFASASSATEQPRSMIDSSFDLKRAILSPEPLGPPSHFEPPQAVATPPTAPPAVATAPAAPAAAAPQATTPRKTVSSKPRQKAAAAARKPRASPLDSYARDSRRQTWPCTGGGICAWTQPR
jgi:hypothetical protein